MPTLTAANDAPAEEREPMQVRVVPSLRREVDHARIDAGLSLSDWMEEAMREKLARKGKT
jgi:predicted HicB family RNase H-like nuclease